MPYWEAALGKVKRNAINQSLFYTPYKRNLNAYHPQIALHYLGIDPHWKGIGLEQLHMAKNHATMRTIQNQQMDNLGESWYRTQKLTYLMESQSQTNVNRNQECKGNREKTEQGGAVDRGSAVIQKSEDVINETLTFSHKKSLENFR